MCDCLNVSSVAIKTFIFEFVVILVARKNSICKHYCSCCDCPLLCIFNHGNLVIVLFVLLFLLFNVLWFISLFQCCKL